LATVRPHDHAQRDVCIRAVAPLSGRTDLHPLLVSALDQVFAPARDLYAASLAAYRTAQATAATTGEALAAADAIFDKAFRSWAPTVRDADGKAVPRELAELLDGALPGDLVQMAPAQEVTRTRYLLEQLPHRPALAGDPTRLAALVVAHAALTSALGAHEAALRTQRDTSAELDLATASFDKAWSFLAKVVAQVAPEDIRALLPSFSSRSRKPASPAPQEEPTEEAALVPVLVTD
jgi:hypothetical protein